VAGILEKAIYQFENRVISAGEGSVKLGFIVEFVHTLQEHEYDAHVAIMGQNGNGKSMLMLALMKLLDPSSITDNKIVFAYDKTSRLISLLKTSKAGVIGIDEAKKFFHYKQSMTTEQIVLQNMIEYARANRNAVIACTNDVRRLNNNYRNSKVQIVVWLLDRYENEDMKSYGLVFIGNPALEEDDKFMLNFVTGAQTFEQIRLIAEGLPTFYGYLFLDDIEKYVSKEEIEFYRVNKNKGIEDMATKFMSRLDKREDREDREDESQDKIERGIKRIRSWGNRER
jgi:hypothetical protein